MARSFAVTTASTTAQLDTSRHGEVTFTVTNTTNRPVRGLITVKPQDATEEAWLTLTGEIERDFSPNSTQQATVRIAVPADAAAGRYPFRLDIASTRDPESDYTEGPTVAFEAPAPAPPPKKRFPWWIPVAAVVVLLVGGAIWWFAREGETVQMVKVPPVKGDTLDRALEKMAAAQLFVRVTGDQNKLNEKVVGTKPEAGEEVEPGSTVTIRMPGRPLRIPPHILKDQLQNFLTNERFKQLQPRLVEPQQ